MIWKASLFIADFCWLLQGEEQLKDISSWRSESHPPHCCCTIHTLWHHASTTTHRSLEALKHPWFPTARTLMVCLRYLNLHPPPCNSHHIFRSPRSIARSPDGMIVQRPKLAPGCFLVLVHLTHPVPFLIKASAPKMCDCLCFSHGEKEEMYL